MIHRGTGEQWLAIGVIIIGLIMAWQIQAIPDQAGYAQIGPRFFPTLVVVALLMCGGALLLNVTRPKKLSAEEEADTEHPSHTRHDPDWRMFILMTGAMLTHMALIGLIGFTLAGTMLCYAICHALETRHPIRDAILSFLFVWGLYHLFVTLGLNLPALVQGVI